VKVLKRYLTYAETGVLDEPAATGRDYDSPLEEDVARVIESLGFLVDSQVGTAGFKIDIGVRDPQHPGRYALAVECDGAAYHGALWARERDRLRQEVLESQGWRFHRIWSTDWFYRRADEFKRLKVALEAAQTKAAQPA
jgi:very-short-patch-repair endonuclease